MKFTLAQPCDLQGYLNQVLTYAAGRKVWLFEGAMGSGKTTLIKEVCRYFSIVDETSSPTFPLINVYEDEKGNEYYHFDFYRIENQKEAIDIGADEYFYSKQYCFIEWSEKITDLLPAEYLKISINLGHSNQRIISLSQDD